MHKASRLWAEQLCVLWVSVVNSSCPNISRGLPQRHRGHREGEGQGRGCMTTRRPDYEIPGAATAKTSNILLTSTWRGHFNRVTPLITSSMTLISCCAESAMQHCIRLLWILFVVAPFVAQAKHVAPSAVQSITNNGVRFVVPNDKGLRAYVQAWDVKTGRKLWTKTIFTHWYIPPFGT